MKGPGGEVGLERGGGEREREREDRRKPWPKNMPADVRRGAHIFSRRRSSPALKAKGRAEDRSSGSGGVEDGVSRRGKRVILTPGTVTPRPRTRRLLHTPRGLDTDAAEAADAFGPPQGGENIAGDEAEDGEEEGEDEVQAAALAEEEEEEEENGEEEEDEVMGRKRATLTPGTETPRPRSRRLLATPVHGSGRASKTEGARLHKLRMQYGYGVSGRGQGGGLEEEAKEEEQRGMGGSEEENGEEQSREWGKEEDDDMGEEDGDFDNDDLQALNTQIESNAL
jgi:hypothetical protein